jgi:23S rRNA (guanosine2251-2'-O)-methyltransferase
LHQGCVAEVEHLDSLSIKEFIKNKMDLTFACLDEVTDPRNIGSIIRSAASFNIDGIIIKERHFPDESKLMYKSASGCMEHINIFKVSNINTTLKFLREKNFWVYGFDAKSQKDFTKIEWKGNNILLFGSEGFGIKKHTEKYTDFLVKIEINQNIESLNISNSAAIVFHHISKRKK